MVNSVYNSMTAYSSAQMKKQAKIKGEKAQNTSGLSKKAEEYLEKLKKKYKNIDFIVKQYETDGEANKYLAAGKGEYNCIITPDLLEQMANDDAVAEKYEGLIDDGLSQIETLKQQVDEKGLGDTVKKYGFSIDTSGTVNFTALINNSLPKAEGKAQGGSTTAVVKGNTIDEMLKNIEAAKNAQIDKEKKTHNTHGNNNEKDVNASYDFKA